MRDIKCSCCEEYRNEWCEKVTDSPHPDILRDCQYFHEAKTRWIPCSERLPEEDFCSGRGVQYSETVLVTVVNNGDDDDTFVDMACTADGVWQLNYPQDTSPLIPKWCKVIAWMPLPDPYKEEEE